MSVLEGHFVSRQSAQHKFALTLQFKTVIFQDVCPQGWWITSSKISAFGTTASGLRPYFPVSGPWADLPRPPEIWTEPFQIQWTSEAEILPFIFIFSYFFFSISYYIFSPLTLCSGRTGSDVKKKAGMVGHWINNVNKKLSFPVELVTTLPLWSCAMFICRDQAQLWLVWSPSSTSCCFQSLWGKVSGARGIEKSSNS